MMMLMSACATKYRVNLGDTPVVIEKIQHGQGKTFVHLHQNETTALTAAKKVVQDKGGVVITLIHPGQRNIVFHLDGKRYEFDPNRIFSDKGIKMTLTNFGAYSQSAHQQVNTLANQIKLLLPREGKIVAVHNNKDYSIREYLPGRSLHRDAADLYLDKQRYYRNFYLVTRSEAFLRLKKLRYNAILQSEEATDDGSLSVFLANHDYINVEAGYGQLYAQVDMLYWA